MAVALKILGIAWQHKALALCVILGAALGVQSYRATRAHDRIAVLEAQAAQWKSAVATSQANEAKLSRAIAAQNAAIEQGRRQLEAMQRAAAEHVAAAQAAEEAARERIVEEAKRHAAELEAATADMSVGDACCHDLDAIHMPTGGAP